MDKLQKVLLSTLLSLYILINHGCVNVYTPYNLTFNSDGFEWQGEGPIINIFDCDVSSPFSKQRNGQALKSAFHTKFKR